MPGSVGACQAGKDFVMLSYIISGFTETLSSGLFDGFLALSAVSMVIMVVRKIFFGGASV